MLMFPAVIQTFARSCFRVQNYGERTLSKYRYAIRNEI
ncbi:hypothetical protein M067_4823 [Bacteroides fragilis str. J-143-4]|nr:hypothetical protein M067_4823 [Bacteroides fragilis str. J-143-4]